jgi:gamma-glutamylcyclotransferase (GGCT)/AIG2-like uncharacterized protein YtfP
MRNKVDTVMKNIFTYGSLMFEQVWSMVATGSYDTLPVKVTGVRRKKVLNAPYPCLIESDSPEDFVEGIVYIGVSGEDVLRLDLFEGERYRRSAVECVSADGSVVAADAYFFRNEFRSLVGEEDWDPVWFREEGIRSFLGE